MSHFVFGVVEGVRETTRQTLSESIQVTWGKSLQQAVVIEMLTYHGKPTLAETPFSLSLPGDDNADALVSPYQVGHERIIKNLRSMLTWLERERAGKGAELWVTEGYDDAFKEVDGSYQHLQHSVSTLLHETESVPSLRFRMR